MHCDTSHRIEPQPTGIQLNNVVLGCQGYHTPSIKQCLIIGLVMTSLYVNNKLINKLPVVGCF